MRWNNVVSAYPNQWLVVEAVEAHVELTSSETWSYRRVLDDVNVVEICADGVAAMHASREHARTHPAREVVCVHTSYPSLQFEEVIIPRRRRATTDRPRVTR